MPGGNLLVDINRLCKELGLIDSSSEKSDGLIVTTTPRLARIAKIDKKNLDSLSENLKQRWSQIKDKEGDYTALAKTVVVKWLEFAEKISSAYNTIGIKIYSLSILMPDITVDKSLFLSSPQSLETVFVSSANVLTLVDTTLKNLSPNDFAQYHPNRHSLDQLTIEEMARILRKGNQANEQILDTHFSKFSTHPKLTYSSELLDFHTLILDYFSFDDFDAFKIKLKEFSEKSLSSWSPELIKNFYITPIIRKKNIKSENKQFKPTFIIKILLNVLLADARTEELNIRFFDLWLWLSGIQDNAAIVAEEQEFCLPYFAKINFTALATANSKLVKEFWLEEYTKKIEQISHKNSSPEPFFENLLEIIQNYCAGDNIAYTRSITFFLHNLHNNAAIEANDFCANQIEIDGKGVFLIEMLFCCATKSNETEKYIKAIAKWMAEINPAFICHAPLLESVYKPLKLGSYFDSEELIKLINALTLNRELVKDKEVLLQSLAPFKGKDWSSCISLISAFFKKALALNTDNDDDYFRVNEREGKKQWIRLAQILAGSRCFGHSSYYNILIPSLKTDCDEIGIPYKNYPPSQFILSEQGDELINLQSLMCKGNLAKTSQPLAPPELRRLSFNPFFQRLYLTQDVTPPALKRKTIESLYRTLLKSNYDFNAASALVETVPLVEAANILYDKLQSFLSTLDSTEKTKFDVQPIQIWQEPAYSFSEAIELVKKGQMCVGFFAKLLLKLVWDYDPWFTFPFLIHDSFTRTNVTIKANINPANINIRVYADEPLVRIKLLKLMYSFMMYQFELEPYGNHSELELFNTKNFFPQDQDLLDLIDLFKAAAKDENDPHLHYQKISSLLKEGRPLFYWEGKTSFIPEAILIECEKLVAEHPDTKTCVKEMAVLLKSKTSYYEKWFKVNAVFENFLKQIPVKNREQLKSNILKYETMLIPKSKIDELIEKWTHPILQKKKIKAPGTLSVFPLSVSPEPKNAYTTPSTPDRPHSYHG